MIFSEEPTEKPHTRNSRAAVNFASLLAFAALLAGFGLFNLFFWDRSEISEAENRPLATLPELDQSALASGEFAQDFDAFLNDRFFLRTAFLSFADDFSFWHGLAGASDLELVTVKTGDLFQDGGASLGDVPPAGATAGAGAAGTATEIPATQDPVNRLVHRGRDKAFLTAGVAGIPPQEAWIEPKVVAPPPDEIIPLAAEAALVNQILFIRNAAFEVLGYRQSSALYYTGAISRFAAQIPSTVPVYSIVAPSHLQQIPIENYGGSRMGANQVAGIDTMYNSLEPRVNGVDVFSSLSKKSEDYIYFRSDHHWTARGAYQSYLAFAQEAGFEPIPLSQYERVEVPGFLGSLYWLNRSTRLSNTPDTVEVFLPFTPNEYWVSLETGAVKFPVVDLDYRTNTNKYRVFLTGDRPHAVIRTEAESEDKILIFKDSYGNAFIPFLLPHYKEIHIIDPRYFEQNVVQYFEENGFDEVLFINYFAVIASARGYARNLYRVIDLSRGEAGSTNADKIGVAGTANTAGTAAAATGTAATGTTTGTTTGTAAAAAATASSN